MRMLAVLIALSVISCEQAAPDETARRAKTTAIAPAGDAQEAPPATGAILIIKPEHAAEADRLFREAGFIPVAMRDRTDRNVEFVFGSEVSDRVWDLTHKVPPHFHAFAAKIEIER